MAEPTSWLLVEAGWEVADGSGELIGEVIAVIGDQDADIFDGLRIEAEGGEERYVPAESVAEIAEGRVALAVDLAELSESPAEDEPGGVEISRDRDAEP